MLTDDAVMAMVEHLVGAPIVGTPNWRCQLIMQFGVWQLVVGAV